MTHKPNVALRVITSIGLLARHASQPAEYEQILAETEDELVELWTARIRDGQNAAG
jgi:hypothetical protein